MESIDTKGFRPMAHNWVSESLDRADLELVVRRCTRDRSMGELMSTSQAVEHLRMLTGDFVTSDERLANTLSMVAVTQGRSVVFDERAGADILNIA